MDIPNCNVCGSKGEFHNWPEGCYICCSNERCSRSEYCDNHMPNYILHDYIDEALDDWSNN